MIRTHLISKMRYSFLTVVQGCNFSGSAGGISERKVKLPLSNIDINVVQGGHGEKSLLLMPGALGSAWTDFKPQIEQLPKLLPDFTIFAWDPPGYGKSIPPQRKFPLDFYKQDSQWANELMLALDRPKYSILGWSDGGISGLISAGTYTDAVKKLVIWGTGAYLNEKECKVLQGIRDVSKWSARMRDPMEKLYGVEGFPKLWSDWIDGALSIYKESDGDYCKNEVDNVKCPVFIIHGKKDPMIDGEEHIPYLKSKLNQFKYYEFPDGKHNIHLRYSEDFNKLIANFLLEC